MAGDLECLQELDIENVFVYVGDAVRYDFIPDKIQNMGINARTFAGGIHSPTSFATIVSGTHFPQHQIGGFTERLSESLPNVVTDVSVNSAFANTINEPQFDPNNSEDIIGETLQVPISPSSVIESITEPFIFIERGPGGHAPYKPDESSAWDYFEKRGSMEPSEYAVEYREALQRDIDWFESQLKVLDERGIRDETLVIYTSDHGELLGEHGSLGHDSPIHETLARVPLVFIHPDIPSGSMDDAVVSHTDIVPTTLGLLETQTDADGLLVGRDLSSEEPANFAHSFYSMKRSLDFINLPPIELQFDSIWDSTGGYVFPRSSRTIRLLVYLKRLLKSPKRRFFRKHALEKLAYLLKGVRRRGAPGISKNTAEELIDDVKSMSQSVEVSESQGEIEDRLRDLGYMQ